MMKVKIENNMAKFENGMWLSKRHVQALYYAMIGLKVQKAKKVPIEYKSFDTPEDFKGIETKVIGCIPARYNSRRCPGKPLIHINGKPMIEMVYNRARQVPRLHALIVATDHKDIFNTVAEFGGNVVMTGKHDSGTDRCLEAVKKLFNLRDSDIIINFQGDYPFFKPEWIPELIGPLLFDNYEMSTLCTRRVPGDNENIVKVLINDYGEAIDFSRTVNHPTINLGIHAYTKKLLTQFVREGKSPSESKHKIEQLRALEMGVQIKAVIV